MASSFQQVAGDRVFRLFLNFVLLRPQILKVELPDYDYQRRIQEQDVDPAEAKEYMKKAGMMPPSPIQEKQMYVSCTGAIVEQFVPPEGDGKASFMSSEVRDNAVPAIELYRGFASSRKVE